MVLATLFEGTTGILFVAMPAAAVAVAAAPLVACRRLSLFAPCVLAALGTVVSLPSAIEVSPEAVGLPPDSVRALHGRIVGDGRATKDGRGLYRIEVTGAAGEGARVYVDGPFLTVLTPDFMPLYAGDEVVVGGAPSSDRKSTRLNSSHYS